MYSHSYGVVTDALIADILPLKSGLTSITSTFDPANEQLEDYQVRRFRAMWLWLCMHTHFNAYHFYLSGLTTAQLDAMEALAFSFEDAKDDRVHSLSLNPVCEKSR